MAAAPSPVLQPLPLGPRVVQEAALPPPRLVATPAQTAVPAPRPQRMPGHGQVVAGVALVTASTLAYALVGVGLILGRQAESNLSRLGGPDSVDRRKDALARGRLGNQLAVGAGISAAVLMGAGIPLIVFGRRKAKRAAAARE